MTEKTDDKGEPSLPTLSRELNVQVRGLEVEPATKLGLAILDALRVISRHTDLDRLDGVTVAVDYEEALASLDRGYETTYVLTPSREFAIGVAMTPVVIRGGIIKSHMVLNANIVWDIQSSEAEFFQHAVYTLAHESAHVELNKIMDKSFPNTLLRKTYPDVLEAFKGRITSACWDEYAACRISAGIGHDPLQGYAETFLLTLNEARGKATSAIQAYRVHGDHSQIMMEVTGYYGNIMKFAAYLLGHLDGMGLTLNDAPGVQDALHGNWFTSFMARLHRTLQAVWAGYGQWKDQAMFDEIGALVLDVLKHVGMTFYRTPDGEIGFHLPYTEETMPSGFSWMARRESRSFQVR